MLKKYPKISIITPSYNQSQFIEKTILSVLEQKYPNLEYIVIDGGSNDETSSILRRYRNKLTYISEKDKGQSDAINKGLRMVRGEIIGYLNSDDILSPHSLLTIGDYFTNHPESFWLTGYCGIIDEYDRTVRPFITSYKNFWLRYFPNKEVLLVLNFISQPATFWRASAVKQIGYFDEKLDFAMDYDYWLRLYTRFPITIIKKELALFRVHRFSKGVTHLQRQLGEGKQIMRKYTDSPFIFFIHTLHDFFTTTIYNRGILS